MCSVGVGIILLKCKPRVAWHKRKWKWKWSLGLHRRTAVLYGYDGWQPKGSYYEMKWHSRPSLLVVGLSAGRQSGLISHRCPGRLKICLRWSSGLSSKRDSSLKTILLQSVTFQCEWGWHHRRRAWRCTEVNGSRRKGCRAFSPLSMTHLWMVLAVTEALAAHTIDDNDASRVVSAALMIARSSRSVVFLGLLLPSWRSVRPWFAHSCRHRQIVAPLLLNCRAIHR